MSLIITGAAGHLGRRAAELLLERVDPAELILVSRSPEAIGDLAARGATVRRGDFDDPGSLVEAFAGGERMLLISTDAIGRRVPQHANAIEAARAAGVRHVAYTSIGDPSADNPAAVVPDHRGTEELLALSGLDWTFLRNALYSEYRIPEAQAAVESGSFHHNHAEGHTAYVSREDCAAAAAAVLAGDDDHAGRAYDITGPELLGGTDLAALYARIGGAPVRAVPVDDATLIAGMEASGLPAEVATLLASFGTAIRGGHLSQLSTAVEDLTGRPATPVDAVLEQALASSALSIGGEQE